MAIVVNLDVMMAKRKKGLTELAGEVDITMANLSILKNNKAKAVRFTTLEAICKALDCQPGDILEYVPDKPEEKKKKKFIKYLTILTVTFIITVQTETNKITVNNTFRRRYGIFS